MRCLVAALLLSVALGLRAQEKEFYFTMDEMPDLVKCLPAPPDTTGDYFTYDIKRYMWGKEQRHNKARAELAEKDAVWTLDALIAQFNDSFGMVISPETTPEIYRLVINGVSTIEQIRVRPKAHFHRKRPFERFNEPVLNEWETKDLRGEGSYPSGHTIRGWSIALLLTEVNPDAANALFKRGWEYGESRVITGAHWQSDVDMSRAAASIGYAKLQTSPAFREQVKKAQKEFKKLSK